VVVYEALAGRLPYAAASAQALLATKLARDPVPLDAVANDLPPGVSDVVMRALARDPAQRYASCAEFAAAFERCVAPAGSRRPWLAAAWLAAAVVLALSVGYALQRRSQTERVPPAAPPRAADPDAGRIHASLGTTPDEFRYAMELCSAALGAACDRSWYDSEIPRDVVIDPVALDATEVTRAAFGRFVAETNYVTTAERRGYSYVAGIKREGANWRSPEGPEGSSAALPEHPVVHVSYDDAQRYCSTAGARLPTSAEWEYAARGAQRRIFAWGNTWDPTRAHWIETDPPGPRPVGSFPEGATPEGLLDLAGNVWEWTSTERAEGRVAKGGSWLASNPAHLRAAAEMVEEPGETASDLGFRCARDR
jgi:hypothetical protein